MFAKTRELKLKFVFVLFLKFDFDHRQIFDAATPNTSHASNKRGL